MPGSERPVLLIAGIAEGLGLSLARSFAESGYDVAGLARSDRVEEDARRAVIKAGGTYAHLQCDVSDESEVTAALGTLDGRVTVAVFAAHALLIKPFADTSASEFEAVWRTTCMGAMVVASAVLPSMAAREEGTVILTGATAGVRGGARFAAFASAKFALRGLAQSLAREYGQQGVHVAHVILDGLIDEPQTKARFGAGEAVRMDPDAIAEGYLDLVRQPRSAWTHELDMRPYTEQF